MKKMFRMLIACCALCVIAGNYGCHKAFNADDDKKVQFFEELKTDPSSISYQKSFAANSKIIARDLAPYHFKKHPPVHRLKTSAEVVAAFKDVKTLDDLKLSFNQLGCSDSKQVVENIVTQANSILAFLQSHPDFNKLDEESRKDVLKSAFSPKKQVNIFRRIQESSEGMGPCYDGFSIAISAADNAAQLQIWGAAMTSLAAGTTFAGGTLGFSYATALVAMAIQMGIIYYAQQQAYDVALQNFDVCMQYS